MQRLRLFLPLLAFFGLASLLFRGLSLDPTALPSARLGERLPEFALETLADGRPVMRSSLEGQVALLNVWATWCHPCRVEHPFLVELARQGVPIYGLNYKDTRDAAINWLDERGDPYQLTIADPEGSLGLDLGVYGAPETYVIDADGFVRYRHVGIVNDRVWRESLADFFLATPAMVTQQ